MSVQSEITRLATAKADIKTAIESKGVAVPDATMLDGMASLIDTIETGGDTTVEDALVTRTISGKYTNSRVTEVGSGVFYLSSGLASVDFPLATSIDTYAFYSCSLTSIDFPQVTSIGSNAFYYCTKLTSVDIPLITSVSTSAFYNCRSLTSIDLPLVTSIGSSAFLSCSKLTALVLRDTTTVCSLAYTNAFNSTPIKNGTGYIYVPDDLVDSYKAATNWSAYAAQIKPLSEYTGG